MKLYDNGGRTIDRYTVILATGDCYSMNGAPLSPSGFNQYVGQLGEQVIEGRHLGKEITIDELPKAHRADVIRAIIERI